MSVRVVTKSRLLYGRDLVLDSVEFWDLLDMPTVVAQPDDTTYEWKMGDRIDLVAKKFYNDPVLWWVIAVANNIELIPTQLDEGALLRIPSPRYVSQVLVARARVAGGRIA